MTRNSHEQEGADSTVRAVASLARAFSRRSIPIASDSVLAHVLNEAQKFIDATRDLEVSTTQAQTDERIIKLAEPILIVQQLSDSIPILTRRRTPALAQRLRQLAAFRKGMAEAEHQFHEAAYELYCGSEFAQRRYTVAFIDPGQTSRYNFRVEFLIKHKWSVECKRPRSEDGILRGVRDACRKIDERPFPGLICLSLENALPGDYFFWELENDDSIIEEVSQRVQAYLDRSGSKLMSAVRESRAIGMLIHYTALSYNHGDETIELPRLRTVLFRNGKRVGRNVIQAVMTFLERNEAVE